MSRISSKEWKLIGLIIIFFIGLSLFFWFWQDAHRPVQSIYLGTQYVNWMDTPVYYSWINQAKNGAWSFYDLFTSEPHPPFFFDIFWLTLGKLAKIFSLSVIVIYQLAKIALIPFLIIVLYYLVAYFFSSVKTRMLAILFVIFASGLGGLLIIAANLSPVFLGWLPTMDTWAADGFNFFILFHSPHIMLALGLMLLIFLWTLIALEKKQWRYSIYAGLAALILFQFHPYDIVTTILVMAGFVLLLMVKNEAPRSLLRGIKRNSPKPSTLPSPPVGGFGGFSASPPSQQPVEYSATENKRIDWFNLRHFFLVLLISSPALIYHFWTYQAFWLKQIISAQNDCLTPAIGNIVLSYGAPLILGLIGLVYIFKNKTSRDREVFLVVWLIVQGALIYFPTNMQRRFILGLQVVINILAIFGLIYLKNIFKIKKLLSPNQMAILIVGFLMIFCCSNYFILAINFFPEKFSFNPRPVYYLPVERLEAMQWLKNNTPSDSVILSSYPTSNSIPAFSLRRVYLGHWDFTADAEQKLVLLNYFFKKNNPHDGRQDFLVKNNINYIFYSQSDKNLGPFDPSAQPYFKQVYRNSGVAIYQVNK